MGATVSEIAGGPADPPPPPPSLVKGVGTKRLGKGRVKNSVITHGPGKLCLYSKTLVLIVYCTKRKLGL